MKKSKKAASILLSVMIVLGLMPMSVFADLDAGQPSEAPANADQIGQYYEVSEADGSLTGQRIESGTQKSYEDGQVLVNKTIGGTDTENLFDIDLEVITKNRIEQKTISQDAAVVLVIDVSGSMTGSRIENAKRAAQTFINSFANADENVQRKVAIVKFSGQNKSIDNKGNLQWDDIDGARTVQSWTNASTLQTENGQTQCQAISGLNAEGGTNIAAGLQLAKNLLASQEIASIENKNVVLLTDGKPTYGMSEDADRTSLDVICPAGSETLIGNGSDTEHATHEQAEDIANTFGNGVSRYAIFVGSNTEWVSCTDKTCPLHGTWERKEKDSHGPGKKPEGEWVETSGTPVSQWLSSDCGFTTLTTENADDLTDKFSQIAQMIEIQAKAWMVSDPMGPYIDFVEFNTDANIVDEFTADSDGTITWDLKKAVPTVSGSEGNETFTYQLSYRVKLNNLKDGYVAGQEYPTNGTTSLTYLISEDGEEDLSQLKTAYFNIPSVKGFAGNLAFTKVDEAGQPLAGAEFTLKAEDGAFSMTAASDAEGKVSFTQIPSGHDYTLEETAAPTGYVKAADKAITVAFGAVSGLTEGEEIVNQLETTSVTVNKIWDDNNNQDESRPESIRVQLLADGAAYGSPVTIKAPNTPGTDEPVTDSPVDEGQETDPQEPEAAAPEQEDVQGEADQPADTTPADAEDPQDADIADDQQEAESGEMQAMSEEGETVTEPAVDPEQAEEPWTYTWTNLPKYKDGKLIIYTVEEVGVPTGYAASYGAATDSNTVRTITNTKQPTTTYTVEKNWNDDNNRDGLRPERISVQLYADGAVSGEPVTVSADTNWRYTWSDLPTFREDGTTPIAYTVAEPTVPAGYTSAVNGNVITNTHTPETIAIPVKKVWNDNDNEAQKRPETVTVNIMNGSSVAATLTLNAENQWTATAENLPKNENGSPINYTVEESTVPDGYTSNVTGGAESGFTVTNTYKAPDIPIVPPYVPPTVDPVDPQPLPPDDPLIEDPDDPTEDPQPLPSDDPLIEDEDPKQPLPEDDPLIEEPEDPDQPKTGDEAPLMALTGLFLASAGALGGIYIRRRNEK